MEQQIDSIAEHIIFQAYSHQATDVHFIQKSETTAISFRIDGKLHHFQFISNNICGRLISHFKYLALMDIGEKRKPQSGAMSIIINKVELDLRISTLPSVHDETLVIRIHPQEAYPPFSTLSLFQNTTKIISSVLQKSHGLYLISGPTGSGKTTTLYSLLNDSNLKQKSIITLEDPVERKYDHMIQVQVNELAGITFENGLKSILRHDPDIILIGEIRDSATAKIAVQAALTGHLVFGTVHAKDSVQTIYRMLDLGISSFELRQVIGGVLTQRLVSINCSYCVGECNVYCPKRRRLAIFEVLYGEYLNTIFHENDSKKIKHQTIADYMKKGYALGYISEEDCIGGL